MSTPTVRELVERHNVDDMALVILIPMPDSDDALLSSNALVFSPHGRISPSSAVDALHAIAWGLEERGANPS